MKWGRKTIGSPLTVIVRGPESQVVPQQLHDECTILVLLLLEFI